MTPDEIIAVLAALIVFIMFIGLGFVWFRDPEKSDRKC